MLPNPTVYRSEMLKNERHSEQNHSEQKHSAHNDQTGSDNNQDQKHALGQHPPIDSVEQLMGSNVVDLKLEAKHGDELGGANVVNNPAANPAVNQNPAEENLPQPADLKTAAPTSKLRTEVGTPQVTVIKGGLEAKSRDLKQFGETKSPSSKKTVSSRGAELKPGVSERHMCQIHVLQSLVVYQNSCKASQNAATKPEALISGGIANIDFISSYTGIDDEKEVQRYLYILEGAKLVRPLPEGDLTSRHWQITEQGVKTLDDLAKLGVY